MEADFSKANPTNLPQVDMITLMDFFSNHPDFHGTEMRGIKAARSARESYGDQAIGRVQVKRVFPLCIIKGEVTPEHKVRQKPYGCTVTINEAEEKIVSASCQGCEGAAAGCKHAVAFLFWLHRRTEEPASTSTTCYWKKAELSKVGSSMKFIKLSEFGKIPECTLDIDSDRCLAEFQDQATKNKVVTQMSGYCGSDNKYSAASLHTLILEFKNQGGLESAEEFMNFMKNKITADMCKEVLDNTVGQSLNKLWYELRFGRITASKIFEAMNCKTMEGSLVETIMGARKVKDNMFLQRGRNLENSVLEEVGKKFNLKIEKCGMFINQEWPVLGASPDGITKNYIFEVKCPSSEKTFSTYIKNNEITYKFYFQMLLQMYLAGKTKGYFCVAAPDFETTKNVTTLLITFDKELCQKIMTDAVSFWEKAIFPLLYKMV
ncbi:uncharacterized protein LOC113466265 [Diaphorina citri]|uniref:Uncharacterized protein LOC113466265 n=1 Tax=Diaphorina citri TaxID=121845 RepID=A0A3Q0IM63_DIACI|nr:uncharacterized protein LOC113466265 [Diaphorina citri]